MNYTLPGYRLFIWGARLARKLTRFSLSTVNIAVYIVHVFICTLGADQVVKLYKILGIFIFVS